MDTTEIDTLFAAAEAADAAWNDCECDACMHGQTMACALYAPSVAANEALAAAEERAADACRRTYYVLVEDGVSYACYDTLDDARDDAADASSGDYGCVTETVWSDREIYEVRAKNEREALTRPRSRSEHVETVTVTIDPEAPPCDDDSPDHDWQSPIEIVGGIVENPGVWGHGGGVTITECCMRCGCRRVTDTWAQRGDTGEQGLRSVEYTSGFYDDRLPELAVDGDDAAEDAAS